MRNTDDRPTAPNYTAPNYANAILIMGLINLLWIFTVIWALYGLPVVLVLAVVLNAGIDCIAARHTT
ncbi:MAG: hypothetical protein CSA70_06365 [Rhodobacterales bacterium]|nr:MAG: hypothetical protein CSA70_06365 [Rhodobacterales bacterium]